MKTKMIVLAVIAMVFALSSAAMAYAETAEPGESAAPGAYDYELLGVIPGSEDVDESEVLPPCDEEYVIDSYAGPILEPGDGEPLRMIRMKTIQFNKISSAKARLSAYVKGSADTTKIAVKAELYKKQGTVYKATGKSETISRASLTLNGYITFAVAASASYKAKVTVTEYKGSSKPVQTASFYVLNSNGY
ncbi:MAG: hypothetical protein HFE76_08390 [Firmicutes bacterium]|nr:hypothetical protein [Bacillota bacterium]